MKRFLLGAALALPHVLPFAQVPSGISLDRDQLVVGDTVTVVVNFEDATRWCGLRVDLGDGDVRDVKVENFPVTLTKQYASAGRFVIRAAGRFVPRGLVSVLPCTGRDRTATLEVAPAQRGGPPSPRQSNVTNVEREEIEKKERERQKRAEKHGHEQRERQQKDEREREKRDRADQRERARRAGEAVHSPPAREAATAAVPVPARPRAPLPASAPTPAASKPRDGSLKVF